MADAWSFYDQNDVCTEEPAYFDATPEGSVIFDWDVTAGCNDTDVATSSSLPFFAHDPSFASAAPNKVPEEGENGPGSKKTRPPKLVREVRDLQESFKQLSCEVQRKAEQAVVQIALDQKASQMDLDEALHQKASQQELQLLSESISDKVENAALQDILQQKVSQHALQEALSEKVSQEHFQQLRHRVTNKLDVAFGAAVKEGLEQKANHSDLNRLWYNLDGKADRTSVQAALAQKVSWNAMTWRMVSCGVLWIVTIAACATALGFMFYALVRQQQQLQQLTTLNEKLTGTIDQLHIHHNNTFAEVDAVKRIIMQLNAPETITSKRIDSTGHTSDKFEISAQAVVKNQVFKTSTVHEDSYTVELIPPFTNAWVIVDASLGAAGIVCSGKADAILRSEHKIFSFYAPPAIEDVSVPAIEDSSSDEAVVPSAADYGDSELASTLVAAPVTTTTTTTPKACMIMTTSLKEQQGGTVVVLLNFKRDPASLDGLNSSRIYNVSGNVQWFPQ